MRTWFGKAVRRKALVPLSARMAEPPEWTPDDAELLAVFLRTETGAKLRARMWDGATKGAIEALGASEFKRGEVSGLAKAIELIEGHAEREEKPEEE